MRYARGTESDNVKTGVTGEQRGSDVVERERCPCQRPQWRRAASEVAAPWRLHGEASLRTISGVPRSTTCIAAEGEGTHDWAAAPGEHEIPPPAMQILEQWAGLVRSFLAGA